MSLLNYIRKFEGGGGFTTPDNYEGLLLFLTHNQGEAGARAIINSARTGSSLSAGIRSNMENQIKNTNFYKEYGVLNAKNFISFFGNRFNNALTNVKNNKLSSAYDTQFRNISKETGIDFNTLKAISFMESSLEPESNAGSYHGLFQLRQSNYPQHNLKDPTVNSRLAGQELLRNKSNMIKDGYLDQNGKFTDLAKIPSGLRRKLDYNFQKKSDSVNIKGLDNNLLFYMATLPDDIRKGIIVTAGSDSHEGKTNSRHLKNRAVDLRYNEGAYNYMMNDPLRRRMGITLLERDHNGKDNRHIHISIGRGTEENGDVLGADFSKSSDWGTFSISDLPTDIDEDFFNIRPTNTSGSTGGSGVDMNELMRIHQQQGMAGVMTVLSERDMDDSTRMRYAEFVQGEADRKKEEEKERQKEEKELYQAQQQALIQEQKEREYVAQSMIEATARTEQQRDQSFNEMMAESQPQPLQPFKIQTDWMQPTGTNAQTGGIINKSPLNKVLDIISKKKMQSGGSIKDIEDSGVHRFSEDPAPRNTRAVTFESNERVGIIPTESNINPEQTVLNTQLEEDVDSPFDAIELGEANVDPRWNKSHSVRINSRANTEKFKDELGAGSEEELLETLGSELGIPTNQQYSNMMRNSDKKLTGAPADWYKGVQNPFGCRGGVCRLQENVIGKGLNEFFYDGMRYKDFDTGVERVWGQNPAADEKFYNKFRTSNFAQDYIQDSFMFKEKNFAGENKKTWKDRIVKGSFDLGKFKKEQPEMYRSYKASGMSDDNIVWSMSEKKSGSDGLKVDPYDESIELPEPGDVLRFRSYFGVKGGLNHSSLIKDTREEPDGSTSFLYVNNHGSIGEDKVADERWVSEDEMRNLLVGGDHGFGYDYADVIKPNFDAMIKKAASKKYNQDFEGIAKDNGVGGKRANLTIKGDFTYNGKKIDVGPNYQKYLDGISNADLSIYKNVDKTALENIISLAAVIPVNETKGGDSIDHGLRMGARRLFGVDVSSGISRIKYGNLHKGDWVKLLKVSNDPAAQKLYKKAKKDFSKVNTQSIEALLHDSPAFAGEATIYTTYENYKSTEANPRKYGSDELNFWKTVALLHNKGRGFNISDEIAFQADNPASYYGRIGVENAKKVKVNITDRPKEEEKKKKFFGIFQDGGCLECDKNINKITFNKNANTIFNNWLQA